jgi:DNA-binding NarL/FixJ family response regulator
MERSRVGAGGARSILVAIIQDHALVRSGLRMLIESRSGFEVVAESAGKTAAIIVRRARPDVIILDPDTGSGNRLDLIPDLMRAAGSATRVIVLTEVKDAEVHRAAIWLGAAGVVLKEEPVGSFLQAIERVHAGEVWLSRSGIQGEQPPAESTAERAISRVRGTGALSKREREVAVLVCAGLRNAQIAHELFISNATVRHHLTSIFAKLSVSGRYQLISLAYRQVANAPATSSTLALVPRG